MNKTIFSCEVFPPKKTMNIETVYKTLDELKDLKPDFISVTYGAGGSENCDNTLNIAERIKNVCGVKSAVHMPCRNMTKKDAEFVLTQFQNAGIESILALRGDGKEGVEQISGSTADWHYNSGYFTNRYSYGVRIRRRG